MGVQRRSGGRREVRRVGVIEVSSIWPLHNVSSIPSMMEAVKSAARGSAEREMPIGFFVLGRDGWRAVTPRGRFGRHELSAALASCFEELGVTLYGGIAEVWASVQAMKDEKLRPSQAPDRMEIVLAGAADRFGNRRLGSFRVARDEDGNRSLGPWEEADNRDIWWLKLIDRRRVLH